MVCSDCSVDFDTDGDNSSFCCSACGSFADDFDVDYGKYDRDDDSPRTRESTEAEIMPPCPNCGVVLNPADPDAYFCPACDNEYESHQLPRSALSLERAAELSKEVAAMFADVSRKFPTTEE